MKDNEPVPISFLIYIFIYVYMVNTHLIVIVICKVFTRSEMINRQQKNFFLICAEVRAFVHLFAFVHLLSKCKRKKRGR